MKAQSTQMGSFVWWSLSGRVDTDKVSSTVSNLDKALPESTLAAHFQLELNSINKRKTANGSSIIVRNGKCYVQPAKTKKHDAVYVAEVTGSTGVNNEGDTSNPLVAEVLGVLHSAYSQAENHLAAGETCHPQLNHWILSWISRRGIRLMEGSPVWLLPGKYSMELEEIKKALNAQDQGFQTAIASRDNETDLAKTVAYQVASEMTRLLEEVSELEKFSVRKKSTYMLKLTKLQAKLNAFSLTMALQLDVVKDARKEVITKMNELIDSNIQ